MPTANKLSVPDKSLISLGLRCIISKMGMLMPYLEEMLSRASH